VRGWVSLLRQTPDFSTSFTSSLKSCRTTEGQLQRSPGIGSSIFSQPQR
jgi:hypothetical protein